MVHVGKYTSPMDAVEICLLYTCNAAIHLSSQIFTLVEQLNIQEEYSNIGAFTQKQELETYICDICTIPKSVPFDAVYTYIIYLVGYAIPPSMSQLPFSGEVLQNLNRKILTF